MAHGILLDANDPWIPRIWMGHGSQGFRQASRIIRSSILLLAYRCPISKLLSRCAFVYVGQQLFNLYWLSVMVKDVDCGSLVKGLLFFTRRATYYRLVNLWVLSRLARVITLTIVMIRSCGNCKFGGWIVKWILYQAEVFVVCVFGRLVDYVCRCSRLCMHLLVISWKSLTQIIDDYIKAVMKGKLFIGTI